MSLAILYRCMLKQQCSERESIIHSRWYTVGCRGVFCELRKGKKGTCLGVGMGSRRGLLCAFTSHLLVNNFIRFLQGLRQMQDPLCTVVRVLWMLRANSAMVALTSSDRPFVPALIECALSRAWKKKAGVVIGLLCAHVLLFLTSVYWAY